MYSVKFVSYPIASEPINSPKETLLSHKAEEGKWVVEAMLFHLCTLTRRLHTLTPVVLNRLEKFY